MGGDLWGVLAVVVMCAGCMAYGLIIGLVASHMNTRAMLMRAWDWR